MKSTDPNYQSSESPKQPQRDMSSYDTEWCSTLPIQSKNSGEADCKKTEKFVRLLQKFTKNPSCMRVMPDKSIFLGMSIHPTERKMEFYTNPTNRVHNDVAPTITSHSPNVVWLAKPQINKEITPPASENL